MQSNSFDKESIIKILRGGLIAGGGVLAVYILEEIAGLDFGTWSVMVAGLCSVLINTIKSYKQGE
ncbi:MAG: hypothetical protein ACTSQA_02505 [Candidatus Heimdallarchaeaceae archaeon]